MNDTNMPSTHEPSPHGAHETRDIDIARVIRLAILLAILVAVVFPVLRLTTRVFETEVAEGDLPLSPLNKPMVPPEPRLQADPQGDLVAHTKAADAVLSSYGWIDRSRGVVQVPIQRAIELMAERGIPGGKPLAPVRQEALP